MSEHKKKRKENEMSKPKHTPGPWRIADIEELDSVAPGEPGFGIYSEDDTRVAQIETEFVEKESIKANAQLIAAAPEMLEALESCFSIENAGRPLTVNTCKLIQKALDKAKGES